MVTRLLADQQTFKVEPRRQPRTPRRPTLAWQQHRVRHAQREQTQRSAQTRSTRATVGGSGTPPPAPTSSSTVVFRDRPPRTGHRVPRLAGSLPTPGGAVDHRLWRCRSAVVMAHDRSGAVRDEWCLRGRGVYRRHAGTAAGLSLRQPQRCRQPGPYWSPIFNRLRCGTGDYIDFSPV